ncbi:hypothetical protein EDB19DRAFT_1828694 [Suillus lakei]|nr:hypothetical protein EDB19DRAFT_1828694 [Suillus lakei]
MPAASSTCIATTTSLLHKIAARSQISAVPGAESSTDRRTPPLENIGAVLEHASKGKTVASGCVKFITAALLALKYDEPTPIVPSAQEANMAGAPAAPPVGTRDCQIRD